MAWQTTDVDAHLKGLSDKQKGLWVKIANRALASCEKDGGRDCEAAAIKQASAVCSKMKESAAVELFETAGTVEDQLVSLLEAGRMLSAKNEQRIRSAKAELDTVLGALDKKDASGAVEESLTESDRSFNDINRLIQAAIPELQSSSPEKYDGGYLCDVFDGFCIYQGRRNATGTRGDAYYRRSYAIDSAGKVTLGKPEQVTRKTVYEPVPTGLGESASPGVATGVALLQEACSFAPGDIALLEAAAPSADVKPLLKLIGVGWGQKGHYSAEVLKRDGPAAFPKNTRNFWNHMTEAEASDRPEGNADHLASVTVEDAKFLEGAAAPAGPGLYARAKVFSDYALKVKEKGPHIGTSIRARGDLKEGEVDGRHGMIVTRIAPSRFNSADYVVLAGAGGQVLLNESAQAPQASGALPQGDPMSMNGAPIGSNTNTNPNDSNSIAESLQLTINGQKTRIQNLETQLAESGRDRGTQFAALTVEKQGFASELADLKIEKLTRGLCEAAGVPKELLPDILESSRMALQPQIKEGRYDEEAMSPIIESRVRAKMSFWAGMNRSGQVTGMGGGTGAASVTLEQAQARLREAYTHSGIDLAAASTAVMGRKV